MDKNFWPPIIALSIPLVALLIPIVAMYVRYQFKIRKEALLHETVRTFAERGQPVPPELLVADELFASNAPANSLDLRRRKMSTLLRQAYFGMYLGVGLGIFLFLINSDDGRWHGDMAWAFGFVPFSFGLASWQIWRHEARQLKQEQDALANRPH